MNFQHGIALVVFDMAGTTVRDDDAVAGCLAAAVAGKVGRVPREEVNRVMGLPKPQAIDWLLRRHQGPPPSQAEVELLHRDFLGRMVDHYRNDPMVAEIPGATETFRRLRAAGVRIALDTGFSRAIVDVLLNRLGWAEGRLLDTTVASDEVLRGRPFPDMIYQAMKRVGVSERIRVAKVGDTPMDLQQGRAAGCRLVIGVTYGTHRREELSGEPHSHLVDSLEEVAELVLSERPQG